MSGVGERLGILIIGIIAGLTGCGVRPLADPLPDRLAAVVSLSGGGYASVLVDMDRAHLSSRVRVSPGLLLIGQDWLSTVQMTPVVAGDGEVGHGLVLHDLLSGSDVLQASFLEVPAFLSVDRDGLWVKTSAGSWRVSAEPGSPELLTGERPIAPGGSLQREGPGNGFHVRCREHRLEVLRPRGDPALWRPVLQGVDGLLGAWWLNDAALPEQERARLDELLKQVGAPVVDAGAVDIDGALAEWTDAAALPVDDPSQVQEGAEWWSGPRDAAFGVAARADGGRLVLALRVRDDALIEGEDRLEIAVGGRLVRLALGPRGRRESGDGWTAAIEPLSGDELAVEIGFDMSTEDALVARPVIWLIDEDPGQGPVRLGTAPDAHLALLAWSLGS